MKELVGYNWGINNGTNITYQNSIPTFNGAEQAISDFGVLFHFC